MLDCSDPTPTVDTLITGKWEPIKTDNLEFYFIKNDTHLEMSEKYNWEQAQFWDDLPLSTRKSFFNNYCKSKPWVRIMQSESLTIII